LATVIAITAVGVTLLVLFGAVATVVKLFSQGEPRAVGNPLETIFQSRVMIGAARLTLLAAALYVALSVLSHIRRGQWLTGAGPFKVSEAARTLRDEAAERRDELKQALAENERLRTRVSTITNEVRTLEAVLARAQSELAKKPSDGDAKEVS
jgi:hypothetical protein